MLKSQKIVEEAKKLIQVGNSEEAKKLLLCEGYFRQLDSIVQQAFKSWFAQPVAFNPEMQTAIDDLFSDDVFIRRKASSYISRKALGTISGKIGECIRDPRTLDILLKALADPDEKVVANITIALAMFCSRYQHPDLRIYDHVKDLFVNHSAEVKIHAVMAIQLFPFSEKWNYIYSVLDKKPSIRAKLVIGQALIEYGDKMDKEHRNRILPKVLSLYETENNPEVKSRFINALRVINDPSILPWLKDCLIKEQDEFHLNEIQNTIECIKSTNSF